MFGLLLRLALIAATVLPKVVAPVAKFVGRVAGKGAKVPKKAAAAGKSALVPAAAGAGGALVVDALLDGGGTSVVVPSGGRVSRRKSDLVKLGELEVLKELVTDPLYSFLAGFLIIEFAQKNGWSGHVAGSVAQVAMGGIAYAKAISPLVQTLGPAANELSGPGPFNIPGVPII